ncbi:MAG: DUF3794 domain-containing protein [Oscillospiraceae bacterium]|nr:DUF3794 domain-containing protein [Oscillospiraceae bacterium]
MELELKRNKLNCYESVLDTAILQEETMEMIVPDAYPDILRIVDTEGLVCLHSKEARAGVAELEGVVETTVLYVPDGAGGVRRLHMQIPFSAKAEGAGVTSRTVLHVNAFVQSADTRLINPRKILTKVNLLFSVYGYDPGEMELCTGVSTDTAEGIQILSGEQTIFLVSGVGEKSFQFVDNLNIPAGKPEMEELLNYRISLSCNDAKIIGTKLIFKGEVSLRILYQSYGGAMQIMDFALPFSQIMEMPGVDEGAQCNVSVILTGAELSMDEGEDRRGLSVSMDMLAQAEIWEAQTVSLISDLYSTAYPTNSQVQNYFFHTARETGEKRQSRRELIETSVLPQMVIDAYVLTGPMVYGREDNVVTFTVDATVWILYIGEDNAAYEASLKIPVTERVPLSNEKSCVCTAKCPGEVFANPAAGGIEVRFPVDFIYMALTDQRTAGITNVTLNETTPFDNAKRPSIVLRLAEEGEVLWDLAKAYGATMDDIRAANEMEPEDEVMPGRLLLIPKKR